MVRLACPVASCTNISTPFGARAALGGQLHTGVDFPVPAGTPVRAPARGVVLRVWWDAGGGRMVAIKHADEGVETRYAHLTTATVRAGDWVNAGDTIALSGASGALVTGAHLHFEVWSGGRAVDPAPFLAGAGAAAPGDSPAAIPRDAGASCPAGYRPGKVDPRAWGWFPGSPWWNRPVDADGNADACIRIGVQEGDNAALVDAGEVVGEVVGELVPVLANVALLAGAALIAWGGIRRILNG